jgi:gamma-glutamyltranspeptidase/glutathione hydrolase
MVATPHELATAAGLAALREGGAAVAANAVLTVVYPDQTAIGGDCLLMYFDGSSGRLHGLNGSGRAPATASRAALREAGYTRMPVRGIHAVTVPGTIAAWDQAAIRFGRLGLSRLLAPAIGYARDGFPVSAGLARRLAGVREMVAGNEALRGNYTVNGGLPRAGQRLRLPELAASLEQIAREGRDAFYRGTIAERIVATSEGLDGMLTLDDLSSHQGEWVEPLTTDYRGVTVAEMPPNSQGLTALIELNLAEQVEPPAKWGTAAHLHPLIEAKKRAFAARDAELSDPEFGAVDTGRLTSKTFAHDLWRDYDPMRALAGTPSLAGDTVYLCAVDRDGNAASLIQSLYMSFGSGVVADGTGIVLQNRGAYFSLDDDHPNRLEGGKRTLHTLMPALLLKDGQLLGPIGTQGGDAQAQVHLQLVTNLVDYGLEPQAAIDAPRWVAGGTGPMDVTLEGRFPKETFAGLATRGHAVRRADDWDASFGHAQMILRDSERGVWRGAADARADGLALGY